MHERGLKKNPPVYPGLNVAVSHFEKGDIPSAITACQQILQADTGNFSAMTLLGILAFYAGNAEAAIRLLEKSLAINDHQLDAHNNLGEIFRSAGKFQLALSHFQKALAINSRHLGTLVNCGNALQDVYRYDEAINVYKMALQVMPNHAGALSNLANIYQQLYRHQEAIDTFTVLLEIDPDYEWALGGRMYSKIHCCDWSDYQANIAAIHQQITAGQRPIKVFELRPISDDPALELRCAQTFANAMYPVPLHAEAVHQHVAPALKVGPITVVYLSADFREHPVSQLLVGVLEQHDREGFKIIGISFGPDDNSAIRGRVTNAFDEFFDVRQQSDGEVADLLQSLNVDIAIDLMGYTTHARPGIFTRRPAPVQISYLGYAGTTGSNVMDYIIADDVIIPKQHEQYFSEKVLRLPAPLLPRDNKLAVCLPPSRTEAGLPEKGFVFCAFNNHYKITPVIFDVWMRLLSQVEGSVLWLSDASVLVKQNLAIEAQKRGVSSNRIIFAKRTKSLEQHIARHALADIFLDTLPYNAHTTASDALWAGLPVVTCMGNIFASRVASSLLQSLSLPELITHSLDEYEKLALALARDAGRLAAIKAKLTANKQLLAVFDATQYARNMERLFTQAVVQKRGNEC